jgi:TolA-binding protein
MESVLYSLARIYSRDMQDCDKALSIYSQIESEFPNSNFAEDALFWKAECLFQLKRISQSVSAYKQYLTRYPDGKWVTEAQIRSGYKITAGTSR